MQFISIYFVLFFIILLIGYYIFPEKKYQYIFILIGNLLFYISWMNDIRDIIVMLFVVLITSGGGILLEKCDTKAKSKTVCILVIIFSLLFLIYFKYSSFIIHHLNPFLMITGKSMPGYTMPVPVGISFYTFQAIGYFIDVYRKKMIPEKNIIRYAAFVTFFPVIVSGPISRADSLLMQMKDKEGKCFSYENLRSGLTTTLYGAFVKLVIADRLAVIADTVFNSYKSYGGFILFFASVCYTLQIYCDFSSYSFMAVGISRIMGYHVMENFKAPYFAESIQEFWRRWHISLSTWFRDYVYIPLGGNRCSRFRKNLNLLLTFLVSGLWHGANWTFLFWGCLHGMYQIMGNIVRPFRERLMKKWNMGEQCFSSRFWKKLFIFLCVSTAWIFFRSDSIQDAFGYIGRMVMRPGIQDILNGKIYSLGLNKLQMDILFLSLLFFAFLDYRKYKYDTNLDEMLSRQDFLFRCLVLCGLFLATFVFGMYGPAFHAQDFIYFHF